MSQKANFLRFGRYEGVWKDDKTGFECEVVIDENNFKAHPDIDKYPYSFDGFLEWRSTVIPKKLGKKGINKMAMEKVRGFYFNYDDENDSKNHELVCMGYEVYQSVDPKESGTSYSCDGYKFDLNPAYKSIDSFCCNHGKWDTSISFKRVASKNELIELLTDRFGNEKGIVIIVSDMLHKYTPPTISLQDEDITEYKLQLRLLLSYQSAIIKPLFADIFNYESESVVKSTKQRLLTVSDGLDIDVGEECNVIYRTPSGWYYAIYNDGKEKDVRHGWIHRHCVEEVQVKKDKLDP